MTTKDAFSNEEWVRVRRAPFVAGMAISLADPGGPFEVAKETMATLRSATNPPSREQLLTEVALELQAMTQRKENPLSDFKPAKDSPVGSQVLTELRAVCDIVEAKADPGRVRRVPQMARHHCGGRCRGREGRWVHGVRSRAGQRGGAGDAGAAEV